MDPHGRASAASPLRSAHTEGASPLRSTHNTEVDSSPVRTFDELLADLPSRPPSAGMAPLLDMASAGGRPEDMTRSQIASVRAHLESHFSDFAYIIGGCDVQYPPLHGPVCELFELWGTPDYKRLMVQLPRGALKSTIFTRSGALWRVVRDPNTTIAIFNEKVERVEKWLIAIASIVATNRLFRVLWPEVIPPGIGRDADKDEKKPRDWKWSSRELLFNRTKSGIPEATISAMSVGGASAGGHWEWLFFDDLISEEARDSRTVMQHVKDWFDTAIYLGLSPESLQAWMNCTRWHYDDVYEHARKYHGFRLYRRAALENGQSSFPRTSNSVGLGWTTEALLRMQELRPISFSAQMQNQPVAGEDTSFDTTKLKRLTLESRNGTEGVRWLDHDPNLTVTDEEPPPWVPLDELAKVLLVDPAPSTEGERKGEPNARNALVMKGLDAWGRRYWLSVWAGREGPIQRAHRILRILREWGTVRLAIEEVAAQKEIIPWVRDLARREYQGYPISYVPLKPGRREKDSRIAGLAGSVAGGWEGALDTCRPLILEEMIPYPYGPTRDILDAGSYDRDPGVVGRPESREEADEREWSDQDRLRQGIDPVTGY